MATIVLVPGAWCGGWVWRKVAPLLRVAGHDVCTPTLTGLGERVHLAHPDIDLDLHITDVANVLAFEDLRNVVLAGWSYSGMVITGVAERMPERLAQLIYLDADVPEDGQTGYEAEGFSASERTADLAAGEAAGIPGFMPVPEDWVRAGTPDEADRAWLLAKMTPHPIATYTKPIRLGNPAAAAIPRAFIFCTEEKEDSYVSTAARVRGAPGWRYRELAAAHGAPINAAQATAEMFLSLV
jgi:pimeloyl-ACP methyl ester carboxylesterase